VSASDDQDRPADHRRRKQAFPLESGDFTPKRLPPRPLGPLFAEDEAALPTFAETRPDRPAFPRRDPHGEEQRSSASSLAGRRPASSNPARAAEPPAATSADRSDAPSQYGAAPGGRPRPDAERATPSGEADAPSRYGAAPGGRSRSSAERATMPGEADAPSRYGAAPGGRPRSSAERATMPGEADAPSRYGAPRGGRSRSSAERATTPTSVSGAQPRMPARPSAGYDRVALSEQRDEDDPRVVAPTRSTRISRFVRFAGPETDGQHPRLEAPLPATAREAMPPGQWPEPLAWSDAWSGLGALELLAGARHWGKVALIALVSLVLIIVFRGGPGDTPLARWVDAQLNGYGGDWSITSSLNVTARPPGDYTVTGPPSLTPQQIDAILRSYGSPATGTGEYWHNLGVQYGIDPAFALAFFIHESGAGTNPNWAGIKPDGRTTHNVGNIICAGYPTCYGRFRDYGSWAEGIEDWYRLISVEYIQGRGTRTVAEIIPIYAPAFENDVQGYVNVVQRLVDEWRAQFNTARPLQGRGMPDEIRPHGNPLRAANTVVTQGYGVGSHAPADVWGAIDLALDGDGDGKADPEGSWERPVYATHSGVVTVTANSYPAGNHVWVTNADYRTGYAHLASFAVSDGQAVRRGDLIGSIGSTGMSSGPHLDYQVWVRQGAKWANVNPLDYGALEALP